MGINNIFITGASGNIGVEIYPQPKKKSIVTSILLLAGTRLKNRGKSFYLSGNWNSEN